MTKTRGFVTIATGQERYFQLAHNLMISYKQFASEKYPFALICDKENAYTKDFDQVVIMKKAHCNYLDKLSLYDYLPYDETIFIDADSLAYGDLDQWWSMFEKAQDFSVFGYAWTDLKCGRGWFIPEGIKEFKDKVSFVPDFNGGVYYLRRTETCKKVFELANYFAQHYSEYQFTDFVTPADEPCLALAMAVYNCMPLDLFEVAFAPKKKQIDLDISVPRAHFYRDKGWEYDVRLIHWSNYKTKQALYKFEVKKLLKMNKSTSGLLDLFLYDRKILLLCLRIGDLPVFLDRVYRKIKKILRRSR